MTFADLNAEFEEPRICDAKLAWCPGLDRPRAVRNLMISRKAELEHCGEIVSIAAAPAARQALIETAKTAVFLACDGFGLHRRHRTAGRCGVGNLVARDGGGARLSPPPTAGVLAASERRNRKGLILVMFAGCFGELVRTRSEKRRGRAFPSSVAERPSKPTALLKGRAFD
ncbi:MAG: hypothetical protein PHS60_03785 [Zavarzinia sp.]|nr:hypothetical protein [Zavarzinia sp.]